MMDPMIIGVNARDTRLYLQLPVNEIIKPDIKQVIFDNKTV